MCLPSVVADDWIVKGFHIHVDGIELVLRPDHLGRVKFVSFFSGPSDSDVKDAIRRATQECLPNADMRKRWLGSIRRARVHLISQRGALRELATGRVAEMHFLQIALERYKP
jgi:hypothetical protein